MRIFKKFKNGWRLKIGGTNGEKFMVLLQYFNRNTGKRGFRLIINFNTEKLIKLFGFNQKHIGV